MSFERKIRQALAWMRLAVLANGMAAGLVLAAGLFLLAIILSKLALLPLDWRYLLPALLAGALAVTAAQYLRRRPDPVRAALALDEAYGLQERFISAWHARRMESEFRAAILADAERHASRVEARRVARWRIGRPLLTALVLAAAALALHHFAPVTDPFGLRSRAAAAAVEKQAVAAEAKKLSELQKKIAEIPRELHSPETRRVTEDLAALQKQFAEGHAPTARDAMARLSSLADRIDQQKKALREKSQTGVGGREEEPQQTAPSRSLTADLERALRRGDLERARAELDRLEEKAGAVGRSAADNAKMGAELTSLAGAIEGQPELSEGLTQAGDGLQQQDAAGTRAGFEKARAALKSIAAAQEEMKALERTLEELEASKARLAAAANGEGAYDPTSGGEKSPGEGGEGGEGADEQGKSGAVRTGRQQSGSDGGAGGQQQGGTGGNQGGDQGASGPESGQNGQGGAQGQQGSGSGQSGSEGRSGQQGGQSGQSGSGGEGGQQGAQGGSQSGQQGQGASDRFSIGSGNRESAGQSGQSSGGSGQQGDASDGGESGGQEQSGGEGQAGGESGGQSAGGASQSGAGQSGQSQSGSSGSASGGSSSQSQPDSDGQGRGAGQGRGGPDWGIGTTNLEDNNRYQAKAKPGENRQAARDSRWTEEFIKLYDTRVTRTNGQLERARARLGEGDFQYSVDVEGQGRREAPKTAATQAFLDYREAQKDALSQEDIPLGYKEFVKDYFDSIDPPAEP